MSTQLHLLNASGRLSPWLNRLEAAFAQSIESIGSLLPVKNVDVVVQAGRRVLPEIGIGGYSPSAGIVYITLDPDHPHLPAALESEFLAALGHELHHCARHGGPGYGCTLGEALVSEGLACHFETELRGRAPFYAHTVGGATVESLLARAQPELRRSTYDHRAWFFGSSSQELPRHSGYSLGFSIVAQYISRHTKPASRLWEVPAEDILIEAFPAVV